MTHAKIIAAAFTLAILAGCGGTGYNTASTSPATNASDAGYYPDTGGSN